MLVIESLNFLFNISFLFFWLLSTYIYTLNNNNAIIYLVQQCGGGYIIDDGQNIRRLFFLAFFFCTELHFGFFLTSCGGVVLHHYLAQIDKLFSYFKKNPHKSYRCCCNFLFIIFFFSSHILGMLSQKDTKLSFA